MYNQAIEISKNSNGIFFVYCGSSLKDEMMCLQHMEMFVMNGPEYSQFTVSEKNQILEKASHDLKNKAAIFKNTQRYINK